jgi:hypothetical protein
VVDAYTPSTSRRALLLYVFAGLVTVALVVVGVFALQSDEHEPGTGESALAPADDNPEGGTRSGAVQGCNTYGENCDGNPIYQDVPPPDYDWTTWPKLTTVVNGTVLEARCWAVGGMTWNYAARATPPDHGPDPYASDVVFNVRVPDSDDWGWIPDTYYVRDASERMGLPRCSRSGGQAG